MNFSKILLSIILLLGATLAQANENLVPPFSGGPTLPEGWTPFQPYMKQFIETDTKDGQTTVTIRKPAGQRSGMMAMQKTLELPEGTKALNLKVELSVSGLQLGSNGWEEIRFMLIFLDESGKELKKKHVAQRMDTQWRTIGRNVPVPEEASTVRVLAGFWQNTVGTMQLRSLSLTPAQVGATVPGLSPEQKPEPMTQSPLRYELDASKISGADIDENTIEETLVVDPALSPAEGQSGGNSHRTFTTVGSALEEAKQLIKQGIPTRIRIHPGHYHEAKLAVRSAEIGGESQETLLVIEGTEPGKALFIGSEPEGWGAETWELVDGEKGIYRHDFEANPFTPEPPKGYRPPTAQITRRTEMIKLNGEFMRPVALEDFVYVKTGKAQWKGGFLGVDPGYYEYRGFVGLDALEPGTFGVAQLGPGEKFYDGHPHPNSIFLRLPEGVETLTEAALEVSVNWRRGLSIEKSNVVLRNLVFELYIGPHLKIEGPLREGETKALHAARDVSNVLLENIRVDYSNTTGLTLLWVNSLTLRNVSSSHNGMVGCYMVYCQNVLVEDFDNSYNNRRGAYSGHVVHAAGGMDFVGRDHLFRRYKTNHNFGYGWGCPKGC